MKTKKVVQKILMNWFNSIEEFKCVKFPAWCIHTNPSDVTELISTSRFYLHLSAEVANILREYSTSGRYEKIGKQFEILLNDTGWTMEQLYEDLWKVYKEDIKIPRRPATVEDNAVAHYIEMMAVPRKQRVDKMKLVIDFLRNRGLEIADNRNLLRDQFAIKDTNIIVEYTINQIFIAFDCEYGEILFESLSHLNFRIKLMNYIRKNYPEIKIINIPNIKEN